MQHNISQAEITKFEQIAEQWWDPKGKFKPLHQITPLRLEYIISQAKKHFQSINNLKILDIGCGGGLVAEPLANLGAKVTAIDASEVSINIAKEHATKSELKINYQQISIEDLAKTKRQFQIVLALEVIEHVEDIELFIQSCCALVAHGGILILSSINQTIKSYLQSIIAAEYILRWLPIGTHQWSKFIKPSKAVSLVGQHEMDLIDMKGLSYKPFSMEWQLNDDIGNNYFLAFLKPLTDKKLIK